MKNEDIRLIEVDALETEKNATYRTYKVNYNNKSQCQPFF